MRATRSTPTSRSQAWGRSAQRAIRSRSLASVLDLLLDLDLAGIWDFTFSGLDIRNTFNTTIGGNLSVDVDVIGLVSQGFPFGNISLLNTPSFEVDFAALSPIQSFSVLVVPEPATLLLALAGGVGLFAIGRRRG